METFFQRFVFPDALERKLRMLVDNPEKLPPFTVLHGEPGTGKTSFAKSFAKLLTDDVIYQPTNESGIPVDEFNEIKKRMKAISVYRDEICAFQKVFIFDEFHNVTKKNQDRFKTVYDEMPNDVRFIFVLNTDVNHGKDLSSVVSPAMFSRMESINFNVAEWEIDELVVKAQQRFPDVSETVLRVKLPDFRQIERANFWDDAI
jgi:replication-associated recombination protein RarA